MNSIFHRTSIRQYKNKPVEKGKIIKLLQAGMQAPSAGNQQPWQFYLVTNPHAREELAAASPYAGCAEDAPLVIVIAMEKAVRFAEFEQIDCAMAAQNILLEADALGLGAVFLGLAPIYQRVRRVNAILRLPNTLDAFGMIAVGYPDEYADAHSRYNVEKIHIVK
ncbi:MAG: nitroreductase family protein [Catenisphaera adipataccumulans]|jgi:nitroreductase|uniref:nitroreductase family protein n=1 Tax=Catenisphaera adipataccumulans TaxID=700500 RepID=UPI003D93E313